MAVDPILLIWLEARNNEGNRRGTDEREQLKGTVEGERL